MDSYNIGTSEHIAVFTEFDTGKLFLMHPSFEGINDPSTLERVYIVIAFELLKNSEVV